MRKSIFVLVVLLILVGGLGASSNNSLASSDTCAPCINQCKDEGIRKELSCFDNPEKTFEQCKTEYYQYVNTCTAVFCNYGGLCQMVID